MSTQNAPADDRQDFWCSATVRYRSVQQKGWWLWTARIQAPTLSTARAYAIQMIESSDREYGELKIQWADAPAYVVTDADIAALRMKVGA